MARRCAWICGLLALVCAGGVAAAPPAYEPQTDRLIVKLRSDASDERPLALTNARRQRLADRAGERLARHREMSGGAHVMRLDRRRAQRDVEAIARRLRADPDVLYAIPDRVVHPQLVPNDPLATQQWYLQGAAQGGINAYTAWDTNTGSAGIVVAVIDTGILPHADLAGRTLPGHDFVSDPNRSNDVNGREANPADPGDWVTAAEAASGPLAGCAVSDSTWHGTRIAGIIAAAGNNGAGIAGINWTSKILPVRAVGKCGGFTSDIVDAIRWAAGIPVAGAPPNANPARVINLSVVTAGMCDVAYQSAINEVTTRGVVVVAAAGNQGQSASDFTPASCANVITAGAVDRNGGLAPYSNTGPAVTISAPGGIGAGADGIIVASDGGAQSPANDSAFRAAQGTSLSAAQVSGVVSLMLSVKPALTPQQVRMLLQSAASGFPAGASAAGSFANCTSSVCGRGILNAANAVAASSAFGGTMPQVRAGPSFTLALRPDGTVWRWGNGSTPIQVAGITNVIQLAAGRDVALVLRSDGSVWGWGNNPWGQLGDGTTASSTTPVQVRGPGGVGFLTDVVAVTVGGLHALALKADGTVWAWGNNLLGVVGDGTSTNRLTPVQVKGPDGIGFLGSIVAISAGDYLSLALKSDGTVWSWGHSFYGGLGRGGDSDLPGEVAVLSNVISISSGRDHALALKSDGTVWSWGWNESGQLGDGTTADASAPVQVVGPGRSGFLDGVSAIAGGYDHSLALKADGTVWAWGGNTRGQLGNGTTLSSDPTTIVPAQVIGLTGVTAIDAGQGCGHSLAVLPDGTVRGWGCNGGGLLGDGSLSWPDRYVPTPVLTGPGGVSFNIGSADPATFAAQLNVPTGTLVTSNAVSLAGVGSGVPVTVSGGEYSLNGGPYRSTSGAVSSGDVVTVRQTSAAGFSTTTTALLVTGGIQRPFSITTMAADNTPNNFGFTAQTGVALGASATSDSLIVGGINAPAAISVAGGVYSINGGAFTSAAGSVASGNTVRVRQTASALPSTSTVATLTIGNVSAAFTVTTQAAGPDPSPNAFNFGSRVHVAPGASVTSSSVTISGINTSAPISITGGEYSINGGSFTSATGSISNGQTVTVRVTAAPSPGTAKSAALTIGGVSGAFNVATRTTTSLPGATPIAAGPHITLSLRSDGTVWRWGSPPSGGFIQPTPIQLDGIAGATRVSVNGYGGIHALILRSDGAVWSWGANLNGQLGDGTTETARDTPVQVRGPAGVGFLTDVVDVAAGNAFSLALKSDGTVWSWGINHSHQLGIGTPAPDSCGLPECALTPVQVKGPGGAGFLAGIVAIAAGDVHSLALKSDGTVWTWGGHGSTVAQVSGLADVMAVSAGGERSLSAAYFSLALRMDGTVWGWGSNEHGQLGDGTNAVRMTPVRVRKPDAQGFLEGITAIAAGYQHSLALRADGVLLAWGDNASGQLGDGSTTNRNLPVPVPGLSAVGSIAAAGDMFGCGHSAVVLADGSVRAWGCNNSSQLGDGTGSGTYIAVAERTAASEVLAQGSIGQFSVLKDDLRPDPFHFANRVGVARGSLSISTPVTVSGLGTGISSTITVASGEYSLNGAAYTSAPGTVVNGNVVTVRQTASSLYNTATVATLTIGTVGASYHVVSERDHAAFASGARIAAGDQHTLLLRLDGTVWAWGYGGNGQLGNGATLSTSAPSRVSALKDIAQIAAGRFHSLALRADGTVWGWGWNALGQVGGAGDSKLVPVQVAGVSNAIAIAAGHTHSLAVGLGGAVFAWGANTDGQLGDGTTGNRAAPAQVKGPAGVGFLSNIVAVAAGDRHSLALAADGTLWAWGGNSFGQLGNGTDDRRLYPVQVSSGVSRIAAGNHHSLALRSDGSLWAWGDNSKGQLGDGSNTSRVVPTPVAGLGSGVTVIAAGQQHSLAVAGAQLYTWGSNEKGQLGDGLEASRSAPFAVPGMTGIAALAGGARHTLALNSSRNLFAFGDNFFGQIGNRTGNFSAQSALLNLLRGDALVSQLLAVQASSVGANSTTGSSSINTEGLEPAVAFGTVQVGVPVAAQARKFVNRSAQSLATVQVSIVAEAGAEFTLAGNGCSAGNLAPEAECTVQIAHVAQAQGSRAGELVFEGAWANGQALTTRVPLASTATAGAAPVATLNPAAVSFPSQAGGTASATQTVVLTNAGAAPLEISSPSVTGDFGQVNDCPVSPATLAPAASCTYSVVFTPSALGGRKGSLTITSNAVNGPTHVVALAGTGVGTPSLQLSASSLNFATPPSTTSAPQALTLTNSGSAPLAIATVAITGAPAATFSYATTCAASLAPGASCPVNVTFSPTGSSPRNATLSITSNAPGGPHTVSLNGVGVDGQSPTAPGNPRAGAVSSSQINLAWNAATDNVAVTAYRVYRGGVLRTTVNSPVTRFGDAALAASTLYSYTVQACDEAGNCSAHSDSASATTLAAGQIQHHLEPGFNLLGNPLDAALDVALTFGNQDVPVPGVTENITSVWKWNAVSGRWAFHSPQLSGLNNTAYAASHGYDSLAAIAPGEGYWVSAVEAMALLMQNGAEFNWNAASFATLAPGFNLLSHASPVTPTQFNSGVNGDLTSLWAWDAVLGKWYFHSPLLEASGGLPAVKAYADTRGYLHFQDDGKTLGAGTGFWVNRP